MLNAVTRSLLASAGAVLASTAFAADITGAGASFPAPVYAKWADAYQKATGNKVNYQSIGSSGGIKQITAKTVDFGASDMPLSPEQLEKDGMQQFPTVIGGVVPVVNIPGVQPGQLKLTGEILANIYLGKITKWNDPAIVALNTNLNLPASDIGVVRRADGSGTTFIFTNYLSKVNAEWKAKVGEGTAIYPVVGLSTGVVSNVFYEAIDPKAAEAAMKQPANQRLVTLAGPTGLIDFVKQRGISEDKAKQCLADSKAADALVAKVQEGAKQYDITGTPTFILNGKVVDGVASWELLRTKLTEAGL